MMIELADLLRVRARQHFDNVIESHAETGALANAVDAREKFLRVQRAVVSLTRAEAVIARAAIPRAKLFAEIREQRRATALGALRVMDHLLELLTCDGFLRLGF